MTHAALQARSVRSAALARRPRATDRRAALWARAAGAMSLLSLLLLVLFYVVYALRGGGDDGDNVFGPANDLIGSLSSALMIPVALALRVHLPDRRATRATQAAGLSAMAILSAGGPLLVVGAVPFEVETPTAVAASLVLALWLFLANRALRRSAAFSPRITRLGELVGAAQLTGGAVVGIGLLMPLQSWPQYVVLGIGAIPGLVGWLGVPIWFLALGRDFARRAHEQRSLAPPDVTATPDVRAPAPRASLHRTLQAVRRAAAWLHLALALVIVVAVFVQVYLIGAYIFGAGHGALEAHRSVGFTVHGFEVLLFLAAVVAWLPRSDLGLSFLLMAVGTVQIALVDAQAWAGGLHPLGALFVLVLATLLARRGLHRRRLSPA